MSTTALPAIFKELYHEIYQNSDRENCHQIEWNIKITAQKSSIEEGINETANTKESTESES